MKWYHYWILREVFKKIKVVDSEGEKGAGVILLNVFLCLLMRLLFVVLVLLKQLIMNKYSNVWSYATIYLFTCKYYTTITAINTLLILSTTEMFSCTFHDIYDICFIFCLNNIQLFFCLVSIIAITTALFRNINTD